MLVRGPEEREECYTVLPPQFPGLKVMVAQGKELLLPGGCRLRIGVCKGVLPPTFGVTLKALYDKGEEKRHGKNRDQKIHYDPESDSRVSRQTCNAGSQLWEEGGRSATGIETT
jgi:hypothetical protein